MKASDSNKKKVSNSKKSNGSRNIGLRRVVTRSASLAEKLATSSAEPKQETIDEGIIVFRERVVYSSIFDVEIPIQPESNWPADIKLEIKLDRSSKISNGYQQSESREYCLREPSSSSSHTNSTYFVSVAKLNSTQLTMKRGEK